VPPLDEAFAESQAGQVGTAAAAGFVADPVQVRADGAGADVQLGGDLGVRTALGDQGDQPRCRALSLSSPEAVTAEGRSGRNSVSIRAYSAAVSGLIAAFFGRPRPGGSQCPPDLAPRARE
jgi:hypothetical protein